MAKNTLKSSVVHLARFVKYIWLFLKIMLESVN